MSSTEETCSSAVAGTTEVSLEQEAKNRPVSITNTARIAFVVFIVICFVRTKVDLMPDKIKWFSPIRHFFLFSKA
jgi:uncharacterized membrane protein AbrB (regulator of aidB expression)